MAIDMTEVKKLFFEESFENVDAMEAALLDLNVGEVDKEQINSIFRAVHSIKGGAGIFKFEGIIAFTHTAETLLDEMRNEKHVVNQDIIDLLLRSVDVIRMMLSHLQDGVEQDESEILACQTELQKILKESTIYKIETDQSSDSSADSSSAFPTSTEESEKSQSHQKPVGWHIAFRPYASMLKTGNDPVNLFRELENLGHLEVKVDTSQLPNFSNIQAQSSYLSWELDLRTNADKNTISEIFEWVEDECDLEISTLYGELDEVVVEAKVEPEILIEDSEETESVDIEKESSTVDEEKSPSIAEEVSEVRQVIQKVNEQSEKSKIEISEREKQSDSSTAVQSGSKNGESLQIKEEKTNSHTESGSIRVNIDKVDDLINIVGELVITQSMLDQIGEEFDSSRLDQLRDGLSQLERSTRELQESVMRIRMLPINVSFSRFPRLVHDLSSKLGKKVTLKLSGEQTELDKTVLEKMSDPMVHLVRNALDHGIEMPEERRIAGKNEYGTVQLHAFHQGSNIIIQISDDGKGFDLAKIRQKATEKRLLSKEDNPSEEQLYEMIFQPGFSTATEVSDLSGRGVGMDVVRRNIRALGGSIDVKSMRGEGTTFSIRLPLTLAILDGQLVRVGQEIYILSLLSIIESLRVDLRLVNTLVNKAEVYRLRDEYIPILRLYELFDTPPSTTQLDQGLLVIVEGDGKKIGIFVDELLSQQQIVIKSLESNFKQVQGISGATILGDGSVALILDTAGLIQLFYHQKGKEAFLMSEQARLSVAV